MDKHEKRCKEKNVDVKSVSVHVKFCDNINLIVAQIILNVLPFYSFCNLELSKNRKIPLLVFGFLARNFLDFLEFLPRSWQWFLTRPQRFCKTFQDGGKESTKNLDFSSKNPRLFKILAKKTEKVLPVSKVLLRQRCNLPHRIVIAITICDVYYKQRMKKTNRWLNFVGVWKIEEGSTSNPTVCTFLAKCQIWSFTIWSVTSSLVKNLWK